MSRLQNLLGMQQANTPVQPNPQTQQPTYPVDWQNGQTAYGTQNQQPTIPPTSQQSQQQQTNAAPQDTQAVQQPPNAVQTNTQAGENQNVVQPQTNVQPQTTAVQQNTTIGDLETPEEAYQRVYNEKSGEPSEARKKQAQSLSELTQYIEQYGKASKPDKEREAKEDKHARQRALFAAIGDGLAALSNLYFTTKGAPNAYNPNASMSKANLERWQRMKAQREKDADKYMNILKTKYGMNSQEVNAEIESEKTKDQMATNAAKRAVNNWDIKIKSDAQKAAQKKNDDDAKYKQDQLDIARKKQKADEDYHSGLLAVAQHNAATKDTLTASTIAKNNAAAGAGSEKKRKRFVYQKNKNGTWTVHTVVGTEDDANKYAKNLNGAWVKGKTKTSTNHIKGTSESKSTPGHRYLPSPNEKFYNRQGNRIVFDYKSNQWVRYVPSKPSKPKQQSTQPKQQQPSSTTPKPKQTSTQKTPKKTVKGF